MKILNLVYPEKSDIEYKIQRFPDGQQNIVLESKHCYHYNFDSVNNSSVLAESVEIKARLNNFKDLEIIIAAVASLRNIGVKEIHLYAPYFLGERSDRQFEEGGNNYLKQVICPIINSLNFASVTVIDPHSFVLEACLNNFKSITNLGLVNFALANGLTANKGMLDYVWLSPDKGAEPKIYFIAKQVGFNGDIITCYKTRDKDGKLSNVHVPAYDFNKDAVMIDDVLDGGTTFLNIAKYIKSFDKKGKLYLIVTHGIFSKGFEELAKYFDAIYCTNSYSDTLKVFENGTMTGVHPFNGNNRADVDFVKQLNVF